MSTPSILARKSVADCEAEVAIGGGLKRSLTKWHRTALGAVIAMGRVLLVFQLGQPRIFYSMARDGLLPPVMAKVHPKYRTPYVGTILTGTFVATFAAFANIAEVVDLSNIGTLFAFVLVSAGVIFLRRSPTDRPAPSAPPVSRTRP